MTGPDSARLCGTRGRRRGEERGRRTQAGARFCGRGRGRPMPHTLGWEDLWGWGGSSCTVHRRLVGCPAARVRRTAVDGRFAGRREPDPSFRSQTRPRTNRTPVHAHAHARWANERADQQRNLPTECLPLPVNVVASAVAVEVTAVDRVAVPVAVPARTRRRSGKSCSARPLPAPTLHTEHVR